MIIYKAFLNYDRDVFNQIHQGNNLKHNAVDNYLIIQEQAFLYSFLDSCVIAKTESTTT